MLLRQSSYGGCRRAILGVSLPLHPYPPSSAINRTTLSDPDVWHKQNQRSFANLVARRATVGEIDEKGGGALEGDSRHPQQTTAEEKGLESSSSTPWYLQVQTRTHSISNPLAERQQLPDLPSEPPPLLRPMLEHISISLGLDDLKLFDLRNVDPPPALGANLVVVIGTARSEKHLHVSADRFCRWLRTAHKLSPFADGLLGRGELKLKMRRKARRARVMNHVGATESGNTDDGIRAGWVCVNVGSIEDGRSPTPRFAEMDNYVGFGSDVKGANIIVQMLVHEKREELELERLLEQTIQRHERRQQRLFRAEGQKQEADPDGHTEDELPKLQSLLP